MTVQILMGAEVEFGVWAPFRANEDGTVNFEPKLVPDEHVRTALATLSPGSQTPNAFLRNGSRLYIDVGAHPEYAGPECLTPLDVVCFERAGEMILSDLFDRYRPVDLWLMKNNTDSNGVTWGAHENFLAPRDINHDEVVRTILGHLITRPLLCGAGAVTEGGAGGWEFALSQRAPHMHEIVSSNSTRQRPIVSARDEPHATKEQWRRLHVTCADSNVSEWALWWRLATTSLLVQMAIHAPDLYPARRALNPLAAMHRISTHPNSPIATDAGTIRAAEWQHELAEGLGVFLDKHDAPEWAADALREWTTALEPIPADDVLGAADALSDRVDWAAKHVALRRCEQRSTEHRGLFGQLRKIDLLYHRIHPVGLGRRLEQAQLLRRLTTETQVRRALTTPPSDTRAAARSRFVAASTGLSKDVTIGINWAQVSLRHQDRTRTVRMPDPFDTDPDGLRTLVEAAEAFRSGEIGTPVPDEFAEVPPRVFPIDLPEDWQGVAFGLDPTLFIPGTDRH